VTTNREIESVSLPHIRNSFRCYYFGLFGLIPFLGASPAWQALKRFKEILEASGETERRAFPKALLYSALVFFPIIALGAGFPTITVLFFALATIYGIWMRIQFKRTAATLWNPARHFAWAGATLARIGLAASLLMVELLYAFTYTNQLLFVR
jgi:hypothetical protein